MGEHVYKHQNNLFLIFMNPISRTSERFIDIAKFKIKPKFVYTLAKN